MTIVKPDPPIFSYKFQGIFNASVFSELAHHTETKMTIFTSGPLQGFRLFSGKSASRPRWLTSTKTKVLPRRFCAECRMWLITAVTGVFGELETSDKFSIEFAGVKIIFRDFHARILIDEISTWQYSQGRNVNIYWLTYFDNEVDWGSVTFALEHAQ